MNSGGGGGGMVVDTEGGGVAVLGVLYIERDGAENQEVGTWGERDYSGSMIPVDYLSLYK